MVTHAGNDLKIWLNGNPLVLATFDPALGGNPPSSITAPSSGINNLAYAWLGGRYTVGGTGYAGYLQNLMSGNKYADFRIYDRALTAAEIEKLKAEEIDAMLAVLNN